MPPTLQKISVDFGAMARPLREQLHGWMPATRFRFYQDSADAVSDLHVRGFITDSMAAAARKKILRRICRAIEEYERTQPANP